MNVPRKVPRVEYKKILYATDLTETGRFAFPYAASIANRYDAKLTVFHVVETVEFEKQVVGYISESLWEEIKTRSLDEARDIITGRKRDDTAIREAVDELCQETTPQGQEKPYVTYDVVVSSGDPVEEIIKEADKWGADLIVVYHNQRRDINEVFSRSCSQRVAGHANCSVLWLRQVLS